MIALDSYAGSVGIETQFCEDNTVWWGMVKVYYHILMDPNIGRAIEFPWDDCQIQSQMIDMTSFSLEEDLILF